MITRVEEQAQIETVHGEGEVASIAVNLSGMNCKKCSEPFHNQENLEEHMTEKHLIMNVFKCTSCQYRSTNRDNYRIHVNTKHIGVKVTQNDGQNTTVKTKDAIEPLTQVATCPFCNQQLCDLLKLKQYIESDHCNTNSSSSDEHESIHIVGTETCFMCKKCTFLEVSKK